ncbi:hypothetical protein MHU86_16951 [Fragilaria crotonensis]|nr:hypothetical protein MHU86_16951 [Fragilaria crotonensis]
MASKLDQDGWPVTTQEPYDLVTELGLPPGPALLACSGSDIVLSRGASAKPSVAKQKGRYVIMLPGILSLRPKSKESADAGADKTGEDEDERDGTTDGATDELQADVATKSKALITSTLLGRMEGLSTDTPVLKIPYPNGGCLTFQGHKVNDSTSRFMMLSFKKGDVVCKDAVSSVIIFGESTYSGPECTDVVELDELTHFGGSDRTIDGGKSVKVKKGTRPVVKTARLTQITTEVPSQTIKTPLRKTPEAKVLVTSDVDEDDSDAYLDDTRDIHSNHALDSARRCSRRSASSKVSYAVDEDEEDGDDDVEVEVDDEQSSDDDGEEANSKKLARKRTRPKRKQRLPVIRMNRRRRSPRSQPESVLQPNRDSDEEQKDKKPSMSARKRAPAKRQPVLDLESDYEQEEEEKTSKPARKRAPAKLKLVHDLDSDNEEKKTSKPARRRAPAMPKPVVDLDSDNEEENPSKLARKRAPAKPQVVFDVDDSDDAAAVNPLKRKRGARNLQKEEFEPSSTQRSVRRSTSKKSELEDAVNLDDRESVDERNVEKSSKRASHKAREGVTSSDGRGSAADDKVSASRARKSHVTSKANGKAIGSGNDNADDDGIDEDFTQEYTPSAKKKELHGKIGRDDGVKENEPPKKRNRTTLAPSSQKSSVLADEKSKSPVSRSLVMASPRSRRRRKPAGVPTSHSPKPQVDTMKSNPDDEYGTFDFSADDIAVLATPEKRVRVKTRT